MVLTCLPTVVSVRTVFDELLDSARSGQIYVDHSTVDMATSRDCGERFAGIGAGFLDAPVSGGPGGASAGSEPTPGRRPCGGLGATAEQRFLGARALGERGLLSSRECSAEFRDNLDVPVDVGERLGCRIFNALYGNRLPGVSPEEQDDLGAEQLAHAALLADLYHQSVNGDDADAVLTRIGHVQIADAPGRGAPATYPSSATSPPWTRTVTPDASASNTWGGFAAREWLWSSCLHSVTTHETRCRRATVRLRKGHDMADLDEQFTRAQADVKTLTSRPDNDTLLKLYALFKQGSQGDVSGKRPGFTDFAGRAKFDAWSKQKGIAQDTAKQSYVDLVNSLLGR